MPRCSSVAVTSRKVCNTGFHTGFLMPILAFSGRSGFLSAMMLTQSAPPDWLRDQVRWPDRVSIARKMRLVSIPDIMTGYGTEEIELDSLPAGPLQSSSISYIRIDSIAPITYPSDYTGELLSPEVLDALPVGYHHIGDDHITFP